MNTKTPLPETQTKIVESTELEPIKQKLLMGNHLSLDESAALFSLIVRGEVSQIDITAILVALKMKGETPDEVAGAARALRDAANPFPRPDYATLDCCGTGGSGKHTVNISSLVAVICACQGLKVVKHGNRSVSSQCGSADVLSQLGVNINMSAATARACLDKTGMTFLFAPLYHQGVRHVMPVRQQLKTRTLFNLLGPLINPANPPFQLMGVYDAGYCMAAAESLRLSGLESAMVVHSEGCDEITLAGPTQVAELKNGRIENYSISASDFGLPEYPLASLRGGTPETNKQLFRDVLNGEASQAIVDTVAANAAAVFYLTGEFQTLKQGVEKAKAIIYSKLGIEKIEQLARLSQTNNDPAASPTAEKEPARVD